MAALDHYNEMFCCFVFLSPREGEIQKYKQNHKSESSKAGEWVFGFVLLNCVHEAWPSLLRVCELLGHLTLTVSNTYISILYFLFFLLPQKMGQSSFSVGCSSPSVLSIRCVFCRSPCALTSLHSILPWAIAFDIVSLGSLADCDSRFAPVFQLNL